MIEFQEKGGITPDGGFVIRIEPSYRPDPGEHIGLESDTAVEAS